MENLYQVRDYQDSKDVLMIAPLHTIRQAFNLHQFAVDRIERETKDGGCSTVCFNHRPTSVQTSGTVLIAKVKI